MELSMDLELRIEIECLNSMFGVVYRIEIIILQTNSKEFKDN